MPDLIVAGSGMAGLCAAARARELGAEVVVFEKGDRAGGSMLLSSGVIWRHRRFDHFRLECPRGDPELQRLVFDGLDDGLDWLVSLGAPVITAGTKNPLICGGTFDTRGLTDALVRAAGEVRLGEPLTSLPRGTPVLLATGGFQGDRELVAQHVTPEAEHLVLRANRWSTGDGLRLGLGAGATTSGGMGEFYGRNMPAPPARVTEGDLSRLSQFYAHHATVSSGAETFETKVWSEIDVVQWTARQPGARAWYRVPHEKLANRVYERTVEEMVSAAIEAGAPAEHDPTGVTVEVRAGITTTVGGLAVDHDLRAADGVYAAGADAGCVMTGGSSSGLAAALVLGRIAAERALA